MARCFGLFGLVVVLLAVLEAAAAQTTHIVLDNQGWIIPQGGAAAYTTWAATKTFMVGDTLVFNFANRQQDVAQVTQIEFDACISTSTIGPILVAGPTNITLTTAGDHYYICTFSGYCAAGQKLAITVFGTPSAAAPPIFVTAPTAGGAATNCPTTESSNERLNLSFYHNKRNRDCSSLATSTTRLLWSRTLLNFMILTIAASIWCFHSILILYV